MWTSAKRVKDLSVSMRVLLTDQKRSCHGDDGVRRLGRMDAVPEQVFIRLLAEERRR
jgi:hypothetical protein